MGQMKHEHHEQIVKRDKPDNPAAEEYYSEQRRQERNKARQAREDAQGKTVPVEPKHEVIFEGRRSYPANPATDAERFEKACREADKEAQKTNANIVVFKNREDQYFTWEERYISKANPIEALYTARPVVKEKK